MFLLYCSCHLASNMAANKLKWNSLMRLLQSVGGRRKTRRRRRRKVPGRLVVSCHSDSGFCLAGGGLCRGMLNARLTVCPVISLTSLPSRRGGRGGGGGIPVWGRATLCCSFSGAEMDRNPPFSLQTLFKYTQDLKIDLKSPASSKTVANS